MSKFLPTDKGSPAIQFGDTGDAVKKIQDFLQNLPYIQEEQKFLADFGASRTYSLTDINRYGKFEQKTHQAILEYQQKNFKRIIKLGNLTSEEFEKEKGQVGYATWTAMLEDMGVKPTKEVAPIVQPPIPEPKKTDNEATHYVKTVDPTSRLALRLAPAYVKVGKNVWEDTKDKGKLVLMLEQNALLKIVDAHIAYNCEWHEVKVIDPDPLYDEARLLQKDVPLFVYAEFVAPLEGTPELLPVYCTQCHEKQIIGKTADFFPDWHSLNECEPFYDAETCSYYITITLDYEITNKKNIERQKIEAMFQGVNELLVFYDKIRGDEQVSRLMNSFQFASIPENGWYLDERPGSKIKFLVRAPAKYFDAIPRFSDPLRKVPSVDEKVSNNWRPAILSSRDLRKNVNETIKILEKYAIEIEEWEGTIVEFDINDEIERLKTFVPRFQEFLEINGYSLREDEEDIFEIGFEGPCYNVVYVLINQEEVSTALNIGLGCFVSSEPIRYQRTMGYIYYLDEIVREKNSKKSWTTFITEYSCPIPKILPTGKPSQNKEFERIKREFGKPLKDEDEKIAEDDKIFEPDFNRRMAKDRRNATEFVGDTLLGCDNIQLMLNRVHSLRDIYSEVLNKINVKDLAASIASCLALDIPPFDLSAIACREVFRSLDLRKLEELLEQLPDIDIPKIRNRMLEIDVNVDEREVLISAIENVVSEGNLCEAVHKVFPTKVEELIEKIKIPEDIKTSFEILTINLPDSLPTEDIMSFIGESIRNAIESALVSALLAIIREIFGMICKICSEKEKLEDKVYGSLNINDILNRSGIKSRVLGEKAFEDLDIPMDSLGEKDIVDFLDDLSNILLPNEIGPLIEGADSNEILTIIKNFTTTKHKGLLPYFSEKTKIKKFFSYFSNFIDPSVYENLGRDTITNESICDEDTDTIRKELLSGKMSEEQADELMQRIKDNRKKRLSEMLKLINRENPLEDMIPSINNCKNKSLGLPNINVAEPPSVTLLNDRVSGLIYDSVGMSFDMDIKGFILNLLSFEYEKNNKSSNESLENAKRSRQAYFKSLENLSDMSSKDSEALMEDPDLTGVGRGKRINIVAPELRELLLNTKNYDKETEIDNFETKYVFKADLPDVKERIEKLKNSLLDSEDRKNYNGLLKSLEKVETTKNLTKEEYIGAFSNLFKAYTEAIENQPEICNKKEKDIKKEAFDVVLSLSKALLPNNVVLNYELPKSDGNKFNINDRYQLFINDIFSNDVIKIDYNEELSKDIKELLRGSYIKLSDDSSNEQNVFASLLSSKWLRVVKQENKKDFEEIGSKINKYFKTNVFHRSMKYFLHKMGVQISDSQLFQKEKLLEVDLFPEEGSDSSLWFCPPDASLQNRRLLDTEGAKNKVKEDYEKATSECNNIQDPTKNTSIFEETNLSNIIVTTIRLYVIEYMLRGIFSFGEFKISDVFGDGSLIKYLVYRIQNRIETESREYYELVKKESKKEVLSRGDDLIDPFYQEDMSAREKDKLTNELHPEYQSGEAFVEFLIKEQLKSISDELEERLTENDAKIDKKIVHDWIPQVDLLRNVSEVEDFLKDNDREGSFVVERYARICDSGAEFIDEENQFEKSIDAEGDFVYGIRLSYVFPTNFKMFRDIEMDATISKKERAYRIAELRQEIEKRLEKDFSLLEKGGVTAKNSYILPIINVEEENLRSGKVFNSVTLESIFSKLEQKMTEIEEFKLLFRYIFPTQRMLSLLSIYSIEAISMVVEGMEDSFEGTKESLRQMYNVLSPSDVPWWKKEDPNIEGLGGNAGIKNIMDGNITTKGPSVNLAKMALMTIPMIVKGMAEFADPSYKLIKKTGMALNWGSVPKVAPVNIFGPFGFGPPLTPWGMMALSLDLLPGERKEKMMKEIREKLSEQDIEKLCLKGKNEKK